MKRFITIIFLTITLLHHYDTTTLSKKQIPIKHKHAKKLIQAQQKSKKTGCQNCVGQSFTYYNTDKILRPGIENIPGASKRFNLKVFLQPFEIRYLNFVHWMHHKLERDNVYNYLKTLNLSITHQGENIPITDWNLLHVFVGDLYPNSQFVTGMHFDHQDIKRFYDYQGNNIKGTIAHPMNKKNRKSSSLFPKTWDPITCVKKSLEVLKHKKAKVSEQQDKIRYTAKIDGVPIKVVVKLIKKPGQATTGKILTFYPVY